MMLTRRFDSFLVFGADHVISTTGKSLDDVRKRSPARCDQVYGEQFRRRVRGMQIEEVLTVPQSPWQNPVAERLIGSVRRECLDHVLVLSERHLRRILARYFSYYHRARTHLALDKDAPDGRPVERAEAGTIMQVPEVGRHRTRQDGL
jgi:transposase InsO family protein